MRKARAAAGSLAFLVLAPGVVAGLVPWWLTRWQVQEQLPYWLPLRVAGVILLAAGVVVLLQAFARFVVEGLGTPAPVAPWSSAGSTGMSAIRCTWRSQRRSWGRR
jgi:hypothetical protein